MKRQILVLFSGLIAMTICISGCGIYSSSTGEDVIEENEKLLEEVEKIPVATNLN